MKRPVIAHGFSFAHVAMLLLASLFSGCSERFDAKTPSTTGVTSPAVGITTEYLWHAGPLPAGTTTVTRTGDGLITSEAFVHWNNREYKLNSRAQLDANGMIESLEISGVSPFGAVIDETFQYADGIASWKTAGEQGSVTTRQPAYYVSGEFGAVGPMSQLVRTAITLPEGEIALFPAGSAIVKALTSVDVEVSGNSVTTTLYAISGLSFGPQFAWFDEQMNLFARDFGRMGMLPAGVDRSVLNTLATAQAEQEALLVEKQSEQLSNKVGKPVLIGNVDIVDVISGTLKVNQHVLIRDGRFASISSTPIMIEDAYRIDGHGKTMIPGLWDMHGHFDLADGTLNIAGGITSVRDLGNTHDRIMELVEKFDNGTVIGPTTYRAAMIDQVGPYANRNPASSLDEALEFVDRFASQGYIQIKLYSSIDPKWVPAIAERVHQHGMRLSGHIPAFMSAEQAVRAGYDEIQHINMVFLNFLAADREDTRQQIRFTLYGNEGGNLDLDSKAVNDFISLLRERDIVVDPTAAIFDSMMRHVPGDPNPMYAAVAEHLPLNVRRGLYNPSFDIGAGRLQAWSNTAINQGRMIKKLHDNGIRIVAGSDGMPAFTIHRELETYAEAGLSNADILKIATIGSASVVGVQDETGSIDVGKASDLVLLDGNPLLDISAVRRGTLVMKGNTVFIPDELYKAVGVAPFFPE